MNGRIDRRSGALFVIVTGILAIGVAAARAEQPTIEQLAAATKSPDEVTRLKAIEELGKLGAPAVAILEPLLRSEAPIERAYAARALGTIGPAAKGAAEGLIALLGDPDDVVQRQAISAFAAIRPGPKVAVPLFVKLMQDSDEGVRIRVMQAVAEAKAAAVPGLIEALKDDKGAYWACLIARDIGPDAAGAAPALVGKLKDKRPEIRREAVLALAAINSPGAATKIASLLSDEPSRTAATYALGALGRIPPEAESVVRANVKSDDALLSTTSLWALARVHPDDVKLKRAAITQLVERLKDEDPFVRTAAARALASLPPSPEISGPIFEKALAGADATTIHYMLDALASLGPQAVPKLIGALKYEPLRAQVAYILGQIGPPAAPATESLARLVSDADANVRIEAATALAKIGPTAKAAVPALIAALEPGEDKPTHCAVYALGRIGPGASAAEPALLGLVEGSDDSLSLLSAWALVQIRGASPATAAKVLPELEAGLKSPLPKSRQMAAEILGSLGPAAKAARAELERMAQGDEDAQVRAAAGKALESIRG
jgi:HEAT repeat protein